jgi:hypothetical protein
VGSWYWVVVSAITVDSQTVTFLAATFRIAPAEGITGYPKTDIHALKGDATSATDLQDFADAGYDPATNKVQGVVLVDTSTAVDSVTGSVGSVTGNVTGSIGSLAAQAKADVNGEVLDVLNVDTFAEETGIPAATSSLRKKIGWMFMWFRNRVTQTGTTSTLFADDTTTPVGTHTVSDDTTTFTSGEGA